MAEPFRKKFERPKEVKRSHAANNESVGEVVSQEDYYLDDEVDDFIKTVEDDVLENKYSSSFEGTNVLEPPQSNNSSSSIQDDIQEEVILPLKSTTPILRLASAKVRQPSSLLNRPVSSILARAAIPSSHEEGNTMMIEESVEDEKLTESLVEIYDDPVS